MTMLNRRHFLATTTLGTALTATVAPWSKVLGANSDIRVAVIGVNTIGKTHLKGFAAIPGVRVVGACDVDSQILGTSTAAHEKDHGSIKKYEDLRQVFDDPGVDAVVVGTPNHWHALATIWGCQAGKDVYVEKPCSYNIWEAQQMAKAAEKYKRIVQVGIQLRSATGLQDWFKELQAGALGKINSVRGIFYSRRASIGRPTGTPTPPATVNHNLWSGPAPLLIDRARYHYDWHWFWELGNGELGNNGPHVLNLARSAIGANEFPKKIWSLGGRFGWDDNGETPNTQIICYDYEPAPIVLEIRNLPAKANTKDNNSYRGSSLGIVVDCEEGSYVGFANGTVYDKEGNKVREIQGNSGGDGGRQNHRLNFLSAMRSRNAAELNCDVTQGHLSSSLCHLGNISHRLGSEMSITEGNERIQSNPFFGDSGQRLVEHLAANDIAPDQNKIQLGAALEFDPATQTFPQSPEANALLRRTYRAPFIVPEEV
ncbi:MAG TPA: Gfo/Idh/MocA family oxidoreductase [Planctomicrobium sp.]|nr:Gfo/Idh/MocA family oxidoreductase [Planctomicrobium sp.]